MLSSTAYVYLTVNKLITAKVKEMSDKLTLWDEDADAVTANCTGSAYGLLDPNDDRNATDTLLAISLAPIVWRSDMSQISDAASML